MPKIHLDINDTHWASFFSQILARQTYDFRTFVTTIDTGPYTVLTHTIVFTIKVTFREDDFGIFGQIAFGARQGTLLTPLEKNHICTKISLAIARGKKASMGDEFDKNYYSDVKVMSMGVGIIEFSLGKTYDSQIGDVKWFREGLIFVLECICGDIAGISGEEKLIVPSPKSDSTMQSPQAGGFVLPKWLEGSESTGTDPETLVKVDHSSVERYTLSDMGGNYTLKAEITKLISFYKNRSHFKTWNIDPPRGVLLYGPPGTGKTLAAKIIAYETGMNFYALSSTEIVSKWLGESARNLQTFFEKIKPPCIVFLDEIDSLVPNRSGNQASSMNTDEIQVINELLREIDGIGKKKDILFIGATNRIQAIDPALLRAGRLDYKILLDYPDHDARREIWQIYLQKALVAIEHDGVISTDVDIEQLSQQSSGFTGADIAEIIRRLLHDYAQGTLASTRVSAIISGKTTLKGLLHLIDKYKQERSINRDITTSKPTERLIDIGGAPILKKEIQMLIQQYKYREVFDDAGISPPRGVLLYGPPGTGKTLAARVIAGELGDTFYTLNPRDFSSVYTNESMLNLEKIFQSLQTPCILFIDEIDAILGRRSGIQGGSSEDAKVINAFLQYMDGFCSKKGVLFIGATNRLDTIDEAILRAGRFDLKLLVGLPDHDGRSELWRMYIEKSKNLKKGNILFAHDIDYRVLADGSDGLTGADIAEIIRRSKQAYVLEQITKREGVSDGDSLKCIDIVQIETTMEIYILERSQSGAKGKIGFNTIT